MGCRPRLQISRSTRRLREVIKTRNHGRAANLHTGRGGRQTSSSPWPWSLRCPYAFGATAVLPLLTCIRRPVLDIGLAGEHCQDSQAGVERRFAVQRNALQSEIGQPRLAEPKARTRPDAPARGSPCYLCRGIRQPLCCTSISCATRVGKVVGYQKLDRIGPDAGTDLDSPTQKKVLEQLPDGSTITSLSPMTTRSRCTCHTEGMELVARISCRNGGSIGFCPRRIVSGLMIGAFSRCACRAIQPTWSITSPISA